MTQRTNYDKIMMNVFNPPTDTRQRVVPSIIEGYLSDEPRRYTQYAKASQINNIFGGSCISHQWSFERSPYDAAMIQESFRR